MSYQIIVETIVVNDADNLILEKQVVLWWKFDDTGYNLRSRYALQKTGVI